jgi:lipid-A-disaccharide synthase
VKLAISSAEISGDLIGAELVKALKIQCPDIEISGLIGEKMHTAGAQKRWDMRQVNVMGFSEVLKKLPALLKLRRAMFQEILRDKPAVFIGVDAPDFNFKLERKLKKNGLKTVHFISPSVWAWRASRVKKIKKSSDLVLCLFPFEVDFYQQHNQRAYFIGHPLAQNLRPRVRHQKGKKILLMPGSRTGEIKRLLPEMLLAAKYLRAKDSLIEINIALADDTHLAWVESQVQGVFDISIGEAHKNIKMADLVITASGTAALEIALIGVPMVVVYKMSALSYAIASRLITSKYICLPNMIANQALVPELIQKSANGANIAQHALDILQKDNTSLIATFADIHQKLDQNSAKQAAEIILKFADE